MLADLILLRHGESTANLAGLFTGSLDVGLTMLGRTQSVRAARLMRSSSVRPDTVLCSPLTRARETASIVVAELGLPLEVELQWLLTERSYGSLTGRTRTDVLAEFGSVAFREWRRSLDGRPPPLSRSGLERLRAQPAFAGCPPEAVAATESLRDVIDRLRPLVDSRIVPELDSGRSVLVVAHGNSLRALVGLLDHLGETELRELNLPAGEPIRYHVGRGGRPTAGSGRYLDPESARRAVAVVGREGGT